MLYKGLFDIDREIQRKAHFFYDADNAFHRALDLRIKIKRCKKCGQMYVYRIRNKNDIERDRGWCYGCSHKKWFGNEIEQLSKQELEVFGNQIYPYILAKVNNTQLEDVFSKYLERIAVILKRRGFLENIDLDRCLRISIGYLNKAKLEGRNRVINFSDCGSFIHSKYGLTEYMGDENE